MSSDYSSLLAFDSMASEQSARVSVYERAMMMAATRGRATDVEYVAECFLKFVQGQRWRLEALDVVLKHANRRDSLDKILEKASKIIKWAAPEPEPVPVLDTRPTKKKKVTKKKT